MIPLKQSKPKTTPPALSMNNAGEIMYAWAKDLYPICRSITGNGVRETFEYLHNIHPDLNIHEVKSGTKVFDWEIPDEWNITEAYIEDEQGNRIIDFADHNLHVLNYSEPIDEWMDLKELDKHLYSLPEKPDAIPYITSYYQRRWGFCLPHSKRQNLKPGKYRAVIDSTLKPGSLTYGDILVKGETDEEILFSTYTCHPSMANNEVSGMIMAAGLAQYIKQQKRRYSYRFVFVPETIGAITYLSKNIDSMKKNTIAGFMLTCVGDDRTYSFIPSRYGNTLADKVARHVLEHKTDKFDEYSFLDRGSDERQYCAPGVDLPVVSLIRSKYLTYPEYHTSLDDLSVISSQGLQGSFDKLTECIEILEKNHVYNNVHLCEPQLGKRGLYPTLADPDSTKKIINLVNTLVYADSTNDVIDIANLTNIYAGDCIKILEQLENADVVKKGSLVFTRC